MARRSRKKKSIFSKKALWGFFIVAIMVLSGVGLMWEGTENTNTKYNGHKFSLYGNQYITEVDDKAYLFSFHPTEVENIEIPKMDILKNTRMLYFVFDPESDIVQDVEVARLDLVQVMSEMNVFAIPAISSESSLYSMYPTASCFNATASVPVIMFTEGNETKVTEGGNCFIFQARDRYDVPLLRDRLLYGILGVI